MIRNRLLRRKVFERDGGVCRRCQLYDPKWEADHCVEIWEGGKDSIENLQTLCRRCHQRKTSDATPVRAKADRLRARSDLTKKRREIR